MFGWGSSCMRNKESTGGKQPREGLEDPKVPNGKSGKKPFIEKRSNIQNERPDTPQPTQLPPSQTGNPPPPAPPPTTASDEPVRREEMTLRDYIAFEALRFSEFDERIVEYCYRLADAMMKERERGE